MAQHTCSHPNAWRGTLAHTDEPDRQGSLSQREGSWDEFRLWKLASRNGPELEISGPYIVGSYPIFLPNNSTQNLDQIFDLPNIFTQYLSSTQWRYPICLPNNLTKYLYPISQFYPITLPNMSTKYLYPISLPNMNISTQYLCPISQFYPITLPKVSTQ